jgi:rubrerythrin
MAKLIYKLVYMNVMKKTNICISVDINTLLAAKTKVSNISAYLNECLAGLSSQSTEDKTKEQLVKDVETYKTNMQELSIKQSLALESIKAIDESKVIKAKQLQEDEQYKRWQCPVCKHLNFMDDERCNKCTLKTRDDSKTIITSTKEVTI